VTIREMREGLVHRGRGYRVEAAPLVHVVECLGYAVIEDDRPGTFDVARARELGIPEGPLFGRLQRGENVPLADGRIIHSRDVVGPSRPGRRIVYCTDTRPCDAAITAARQLILTHFSARYGDVTPLVDEARRTFSATTAAADFAEIEVLAPLQPHPYNPLSRESPPEEGR
jgi:ribonuclease Z